MKKNELSKLNAKKSLYFAGSISLGVAVVGTAIAVPLYIKIQDQLKENITSLTNLSKFITQLTSKLGVSPDNEFTKRLKDGYTLSIDAEGGTRIYRSINGEEALIMNMNPDGTVGTASSMSGLAAQKMISIIDEAKDTIGAEASAMSDILGPYVEEAEKTSLEIESAVTGVSADVLRSRNALATNDVHEAEERLAQLKASGVDTDAARAKAQEMADNAKEEQKALASTDTAAAAAAMEKAKKEAEAKIAAAQNELKGAFIDFMIKNDDVYSESDRARLLAMEKAKLQELYDASKNKLAEETAKKASEASTNAQVERAASGNSGNIIKRILANPASFANTFIASFGNATKGKTQSPNLRKSFYNELSKMGVTDTFFERLVVYFGNDVLHIPKDELIDWKNFAEINTTPSITVSTSKLVNTYTEERSDIARLLILNMDITEASGVKHTGATLFRSSPKHILAFDDIYEVVPGWTPANDPLHPEFENQKYESIKSLINLLNSQITGLHIEAYKLLIDAISHPNALPHIQNEDIINEALTIMSGLFDEQQMGWPKAFVDGFVNMIVKDAIFNNKSVNFDKHKLIDAMKTAVKMDKKYNHIDNTFEADDAYSHPNTNWRNKLIFDFKDSKDVNGTLDKWIDIGNTLFTNNNSIKLQRFIDNESNIRNYVFGTENIPFALSKEVNANVDRLMQGFNYNYKEVIDMIDIAAKDQKHEKQYSHLIANLNKVGTLITNKEMFYRLDKQFIINLLTIKNEDISNKLKLFSSLTQNSIYSTSAENPLAVKSFNMIDIINSKTFDATQKQTLIDKFIAIISAPASNITIDKIILIERYMDAIINNQTDINDAFRMINNALKLSDFNTNIVNMNRFILWLEAANKEGNNDADSIITKGVALEQAVGKSVVKTPDEEPVTGIQKIADKYYSVTYKGGHIFNIKPLEGKESLYIILHKFTIGNLPSINEHYHYSAPGYDATSGKLVYANKSFTDLIIYDMATKNYKVVPIQTTGSMHQIGAIKIDSTGHIIVCSKDQATFISTQTTDQLFKANGAQLVLRSIHAAAGASSQLGNRVEYFEGLNPVTGTNVKWILYANTDSDQIDIVDATTGASLPSINHNALAMNVDTNGNLYVIDGHYNVVKINLFDTAHTEQVMFKITDLIDDRGNPVHVSLSKTAIVYNEAKDEFWIVTNQELFVVKDKRAEIKAIVDKLYS